MYKAHLFSLLFCCLAMVGLSQTGLVFSRLSMAEGLATNKIKCTWQDEKGFLWVGHENGLQRFDGRKFISFNFSDPQRMLPPTGVDEMYDAGNNRLWIRQGSKIGLFDLKNFLYKKVNTPQLSGKADLRLYIGKRKSAWLLASTNDIYLYDSVSNSFKKDGLPFQLPAGWPVSGLLEDKTSQDYWFFGDEGIAFYDTKQQQLVYAGDLKNQQSVIRYMGKKKVHSFFIASDHTYWIAYREKALPENEINILHYDPAREKILLDTIVHSSRPEAYVAISYMIEAGKDIWMAGTNSMLSYSQSGQRLYQHLQSSPSGYGLEGKHVYHLLEDREANVWVSTDNGLFMTGPEKEGVTNFGFSNKNGEVQVQSVIGTANEEIWIGTRESGIIFMDRSNRRLPAVTPKTGDLTTDKYLRRIAAMHQHRSTSHIWAACDGGYIMVIDPETKKILRHFQPEVFEQEAIKAMAEDDHGDLWFATRSGRLVKWERNASYSPVSFQLVQDMDTELNQFIIDKQQRKWLATAYQGLYMLAADGKRIVNHFKSTDSNIVSILSDKVADVVQYNDSIFFAGTDGGLSIINGNTGVADNRTIYNGLPATSIRQIMPDKEGAVWLITNNGLCSYHVKKNFFTSYTQRDGIVYADKATLAKAILYGDNIWFAGENVMFTFIPKAFKSVAPPPPVTITDFRVLDAFHPVDSLLTLKQILLQNQEHSFSIYFSALNFSQQDRLTYYYMLEGVDKDWVYGDKSPMASYSVLSPGSYTFKVRCENIDGVSSPVTTIHIRIRPPFFKTWWFLAIILMAFLGLIYWLYRQRVKRLLALEKLRTKVARDLHDDMGSTLSTINILSAMAKSRMNTHPENASEYLSKISENSQHMMEVMDDIVWSIKPDNDSMLKITGRMRELATSLMEAKDIELSFIADDSTRNIKLNMEARRDFFLIFKEAVNNIVKYANCSQVRITISSRQQHLHLLVADNGTGFDQAAADGGNGLGNMQKRAEALRGKLSIRSAVGEGTQIELTMPVQ